MIRRMGAVLACAALLASAPAQAQAQGRIGAEALAAMPLDAVVATMRGRCGMMVTAMAELHRRYPGKPVEDCGGARPDPEDATYRPMDDDTLLAAIEDLSADLEALVARGEAIQAAAAGDQPAAATEPTAPPDPAPDPRPD